MWPFAARPNPASNLATVLDQHLADLVPEPVLTAWRQAALALSDGTPVDTAAAAAACKAAGTDTGTVLRLQQAVQDALRAAVRSRRWWQRFTPQAVPDDVIAGLCGFTAAVLTAQAESPPPEPLREPSGADSAGISGVERQADWLADATEKTAAAAGRVSERCGMVLEASAMAFYGIQTNAEVSAQLAQSIEAVSGQLSHAADASMDASAAADQASGEIVHLEEAASKISSVIGLIRRIAAQTNLLALNATIEAARAGEAGRGFAVVANEVKALARQTADATATISTTIQEMNQAVEAAAERVRGIQRAASEVKNMTTSGATALAEQRAATAEISSASADAAAAVARMQDGIEEVATQSFELTTTIENLLSGVEIMNAKATRAAA